MRKLLKVLGIIVLTLVIILSLGIIYFNSSFPKVSPPSDITVVPSPERIARGAYLAKHVAMCIDCHSERDYSKFTAPVIVSTYGKGGELFGEKNMGLPGNLYAMNITPAGIGKWTDGELLRAFTQGVTKDNKALFPIMPYTHFNTISEEDAYSIIAYIRTLKPIENKVPASELNFLLNMIVKTMPVAAYNPQPVPDKNDPAAYGKYLVNMASCSECHTPSVKGEPVKGMEFAGGMEFYLPGGTIRSLNLTPDNETGIGKWSKQDFINRFKIMSTDSAKNIPVDKYDFNTPMPWTMYAGMTDEDLGAVYSYLRTLKPVYHKVEKFTPGVKY